MMGLLQKYRDYAPAAGDRKGLGLENRQDWLVLTGVNRDSGTLARSNWITIQKALDERGTEYETPSFGHWLCGWIEVLIVHPKHAEHAEEIAQRLEDYPVFDEDHWSQLETDEIDEYWESCSLKEKIEYCQDAGVSIFAARRFPDEVYDSLRDGWE